MADIDRVVYQHVPGSADGATVRQYRVLLDGAQVGTVAAHRSTRRKRRTWSSSGDVTTVTWMATPLGGIVGQPWTTRRRAVEIMLGQRRG